MFSGSSVDENILPMWQSKDFQLNLLWFSSHDACEGINTNEFIKTDSECIILGTDEDLNNCITNNSIRDIQETEKRKECENLISIKSNYTAKEDSCSPRWNLSKNENDSKSRLSKHKTLSNRINNKEKKGNVTLSM